MSFLGISLMSSNLNHTKPISVPLIRQDPILTFSSGPNPSNANPWQFITYDSYNGTPTFLAVANSGINTIAHLTGSAPSSWSMSSLGTNNTANGCCIGSNRRVITSRIPGPSGRIFTNTSISIGAAWTSQSTTNNYIYGPICFGINKFIALRTGSTNNIAVCDITVSISTWNQHTLPTSTSWQSVCFGNGLFVAISSSGEVATSSNGTSWNSRTTQANDNWRSVCYGLLDGPTHRFVAVSSNGGVMTSSDGGITWTAGTAAQANSWQSVCFGNGLFVAVSSNDAVGGATGLKRVMSSPDGITWTAGTAPEAYSWKSITYGNGRFLAVSSDGGNSRVMTCAY